MLDPVNDNCSIYRKTAKSIMEQQNTEKMFLEFVKEDTPIINSKDMIKKKHPSQLMASCSFITYSKGDAGVKYTNYTKFHQERWKASKNKSK